MHFRVALLVVSVTDSRSPAHQAAALVADPDRYEGFAAAYDDELSFYGELRSNAQKSLETFDDYLELRRIFLARGPTEPIRDRIEDRLDRSLKNMVLGTSARGRAYPVETVTELADRLAAFASLGVDTPSLETVIKTTVEYCYDDTDDPVGRHTVFDRLLADTPSETTTGTHDAIEFLARARFAERLVETANPDDVFDDAVRAYLAAVDDPAPGDDRSAEVCLTAADDRAFADEKKRALHELAVHRGDARETLPGYLYLAATSAVEAYRHGEPTTRADLLVAHRSLRCLDRLSVGRSDQRAAYGAAYTHVARAIEQGGGRWETNRAGTPSPSWGTVVREYAAAAAEVRCADTLRFIKYLSKSFRHAAHVVDDRPTRIRVHRVAVNLFDRIDQSAIAPSSVQVPTPEFKTVREGTVATHRCRLQTALAHRRLEAHEYDAASAAATRAREAAANAPQASLGTEPLTSVTTLADARRAELAGEFETALTTYEELAELSGDNAITGDVDANTVLCRVKRHLCRGDDREALRTARRAFDADNPVTAGVATVAGVVPDEDRLVSQSSLTDQFASIDETAVKTLLALARLSAGGGVPAELVRDPLRELVCEL